MGALQNEDGGAHVIPVARPLKWPKWYSPVVETYQVIEGILILSSGLRLLSISTAPGKVSV